MIELKNISVTFRQKDRQVQAVKDVDLTIEEGDIYGIVGYSGAGKSTLLRLSGSSTSCNAQQADK
mgnify:CR=1 FL=1